MPFEVRSSAPKYGFGFGKWLRKNGRRAAILAPLCSSRSGTSNDIRFVWVRSTLGLDLGPRTGQSPPGQEVGQRRSCHILFDSVGLPESSGR